MSESGFGAEFPDSGEDWPHVGCLLGARLEDAASWGVGLIRRLLVNANGMRYVGVQMLGKSASLVTLIPAQEDKAQRLEQETAFYVPGSDSRGLESGEVTLLVRIGSFAAQRNAIMRVYDKEYAPIAEQVVETGRNFQLVKYRLGHTTD